MTITFTDRYPAPSAGALAEFEVALGATLPDAYKAWLMREGGGRAGGDVFLDAAPANQTLVDHFHGLIGSRHGSIEAPNLGSFSAATERVLLPFAAEMGGDPLVIDLRPATYGRVYLRAHDAPPNDPPLIDMTGMDEGDVEEASIYHPVAPSFEAFMDMLGPEPD